MFRLFQPPHLAHAWLFDIAVIMPRHRSLIRLVLNLLAMAVTLAPLGLAVAALIRSDHRWFDLANQFVAPAFLASIVWLLLLWLVRLRPAAIIATITTGLLLWAVWPQWFTPRIQSDPASETLTVYSANVWARNTDMAAMARSIADAKADIVLLVEVGDAPAADLDVLLPDHPHRVVSIVGNRTVAPARALVASRWPLKPLKENVEDQLFSAAARVPTPLGEIGVMSVHLTRPWPYQYQWAQIIQTEDMAKQRPRLGDAAIIAGDFNAVSSGRIGRQVKDSMGLIPAPAPVHAGTWPAKLPAFAGITIDQVWHSPQLALVDRRLGLKNGSDHRPVITRFRSPAPAQ